MRSNNKASPEHRRIKTLNMLNKYIDERSMQRHSGFQFPISKSIQPQLGSTKERCLDLHYNVNSSPIKKSVVFCEEVDSLSVSDSTLSSPKLTSSKSKLPTKSILKHSSLKAMRSVIEETKKLEDNNDSISFGSPSQNLVNSQLVTTYINANPMDFEYWALGEVHNLFDINSISDYQNIIEGGLKCLCENINKQFEIYATFNNIIPLISSNNDTEINQKKINVIIDHIDSLLEVSLKDLKKTQCILLKSDKKDPFISRLYVQLVRVISSVISNAKIMNSLHEDLRLQEMIKEILTLSIESLKHDNTNKVIATAQFSLLREEKFSQLYLSMPEIRQFIEALVDMKEIYSTNLSCEKLLLLKHFLTKYSSLMIDTIKLWLPGEILARILIVHELYSLKITVSAVSTLLDLLKRSLNDNRIQLAICGIEKSKAGQIIPEKYFNRLDKQTIINIQEKSMEDLFYTQIQTLLKSQEYKLGMDLWLSLIGLFFNNTNKLSELLTESGQRWLSLNRICFDTGKPQAKSLALKTWRIVIYVIINNISINTPDSEIFCSTLLLPLEYISSNDSNDINVIEGLNYLLSGLFYLIFCDDGGLDSARFQFFYSNILTPLFHSFFSNNKLPSIIENVQSIMLRLVSLNRENEKQLKEFNALKVITSAGISVTDIIPFNSSIIQNNWEIISDLVASTMNYTGSNQLTVFYSLVELLKRIPTPLKVMNEYIKYSNLLLECFSNYIKLNDDIDNLDIIVLKLTKCLSYAFGLLLFEKIEGQSYFIRLWHVLRKEKKEHILFFKQILEATKDIIPDLYICEEFLQLNDHAITTYIGNIVGSRLLSPKMSPRMFNSLLKITNVVPTCDVIDTLLNIVPNTKFQNNLLERLNLSDWKNDDLLYFIKRYVQKNINNLNKLLDVLESIIDVRPEVFIKLLKILLKSGKIQLVRNIINKKFALVESLSIFEEILFQEILTSETAAYFFKERNNSDSWVQRKLISCLVFYQDLETLNMSYTKVEDNLLEYQVQHLSTKELIRTVLDLSMERCSWLLMNKVLGTCIKIGAFSLIEDNLSKREGIILENIDILLTAVLLCKCEKITNQLISLVKTHFQKESSDSCLKFIRELIERNNYKVFSLCHKEFLTFIFNKGNSFTDSNKKEAMELFPVLADYLLGQNKKSMTNTLEIISSLLPSDNKEYCFNLTARIVLHPKFNIEGYDHLVKLINDWKHGTETPKKTPQMYRFISPSKSSPSMSITKPVTIGIISDLSPKNFFETPTTNQSECSSKTKLLNDNKSEVVDTHIFSEYISRHDHYMSSVSDDLDLDGFNTPKNSKGRSSTDENIDKIIPESNSNRSISLQVASLQRESSEYETEDERKYDYKTFSCKKRDCANSSHLSHINDEIKTSKFQHKDYKNIHYDMLENDITMSMNSMLDQESTYDLPSSPEKIEDINFISLSSQKKDGSYKIATVDTDLNSKPDNEKLMTDVKNTQNISIKGVCSDNQASDELIDNGNEVSVIQIPKILLFKGSHRFPPNKSCGKVNNCSEKVGNWRSTLGLNKNPLPEVVIQDKNEILRTSHRVDLHKDVTSLKRERYGTMDDDLSKDSTHINEISLKALFPSKKVRRIVTRLHNISTSEISNIHEDEKKKLKKELLAFMMKLEG